MRPIKTCIAATSFLMASSLSGHAQNIEFWTFLDPEGSGIRSELVNRILTRFEEQNPGVSVNTNVIQWTEIGPQLLRAARAGNVPDVVMLYSPYMQPQVAANTLRPLDTYVDEWSDEDREDVITLPMARGRDGQLYGLPWELRAYGFVHRADLFAEAGLEAPKTMDDMVQSLQQLRTDGRQGIAASFSPSTSTAPIEWFLPSAISLGAEVLNEDGSASFQGEPMERMLQALHDLVHEHGVLSLETALMQSDDAQNTAIAGQAVAHAQGSHRLSTIQERSQPGWQWSFSPFPALDPESPPALSLQGWNLAIPRQASHPDIAWKLIEYWTSYEVQLEQAVEAGYLPMRRSVAEDPEFRTDQNVQFALPELLDYAAAYTLDFDWPENTDALNDALGRMIQQVLTQNMTPQEATAWGEQTYNEQRR